MTRTRFVVAMWAAVTAVIILGDHFFHVRTGILHYEQGPLVDGQSVWVWLVFAVAVIAMIASALLTPITSVPPSVQWGGIAVSGLVFVAAYGVSGMVGNSHPAALFVGLVVLWLARVVLLRREDRMLYLAYGLLLAVCGVVGEGLVSKAGLFAYQLQQVVDCPWWLAGLYLHGSITLLQIARGWRSYGPRSGGGAGEHQTVLVGVGHAGGGTSWHRGR